MDPRRKLQVVSAANPSLRVSAAPKQLSIAPAPANNTQLRVASAPQQQVKIVVPKGVPQTQSYTPPPEIKRPKQSFWNKARDILDANTEADQYRRYMANQEKVRIRGQNAPGQVPIIDENPGNIISNTIGAVPRMFNTAANQIVEVGYTAQQQFATREYSNAVKDLLAAQKSGNRTWYEAAKRRADAAAQRVSNIEDMIKATKSNYTENKGGLFNAGTLYNEQDSYEGKLTTGLRKIGGGTAEGMFDVASLGLTGVAGKQVAKQGLKQTLKESGKIIAKNAALNTGQGMASSFRQGGDIKDVALSGAASGVIGTGADIALAGSGGFIARNISKLRNKFNPIEKQVTKYLTKESSETAIKSILESGFNVPAENIDAITKYVANETNGQAIDKLVRELSIDPNLELTPDVIKQLQDNGIKEVKRDANAQYEAQYKDGGITARGQAALDRNVYHELGHHIYINKLTPEERALFTGTGDASKQAVGRTGYTQSDINSEDFSDYLDRALRGRIDEVPAEYQAVVRKYAKIADAIAATEKVPIGTTTINTSLPQTPTNTTKVPVGNLGGIDAVKAAAKTKENAARQIADAQAQIDELLQSGDTSTAALTKIDNLHKTIDNLKVAEQELPSETVIAQQGVNQTTVDQAGKQLSGVAPEQVDEAVQTGTTPLAADTTADSAKITEQVSNAAAGLPQTNDVLVKAPGTNMADANGNLYIEQAVPVKSLVRNADYQPRTTASGKGTENSVYAKGYQEGMVDQPMLVRKNGDKYEVLGGHSRTLGMERRAAEGLPNPETVTARVYDNISDEQAKIIARGANQGGQYESTLDMAKSIADSMSENVAPSVQKQNMVKGFSFEDYDHLWKTVDTNPVLKEKVFHGAISQEDVLAISRHARSKGLDPERTQAVISGLDRNGKLTKQNATNVIDLLSGKIKSGLMRDAQTGLFGDMESAVNSVDLLAEYTKTAKELVRRRNAVKLASKESGLTVTARNQLQRANAALDKRLDDISKEIVQKHNARVGAPQPSVENPTLAGFAPVTQPATPPAKPVYARTNDAGKIVTVDGRTAEDLVAQARQQESKFVEDMRAITAENNGIPNEKFYSNAVKKDMARIVDKIVGKDGRPPTDILRSTIIVKDPAGNIDDIMRSFEQRGYTVWMNDITNRYTDGSTGYKDIAIKFVNGADDPIVKELQIMTPNMAAAKNELGGHALYKQIENAPRITPKDFEEIEALTARMNKLYADADALDAAAIKASSVEGVPSTRALAGADSAPEAVTAPISPSGNTNTLTSSPSTTKNRGSLLRESVIGDPLSTTSIAENGANVKNISERGFARSLSQTDTPPEVYENLLGYQSRPNTQTFDQAAQSIAQNEQGVLESILSKPQAALNDAEHAQALLLLDKAIKNDQLDLAEQIASKINVSGTENGRAVQILAAVRKTTPEGAYLEVQKVITEAQKKGLLPKDYKLPKETSDAIKGQAQYVQDMKAYNAELAKHLETLDPNSQAYADVARELAWGTREHELSVAVLGKKIKDVVPPTVGDKLNSIVNISLLLNPKTFIRNIIGNTANATGEAISSTISTPLDVLASLRTGNRTVKLPNILKRFGGFGRGLKEGAQETELGVRIGGGGKYDINPAVFKSKVMSRIEKTLGHSLSDMDKAFATAQFDETLDSLMRANKVSKPTQEMLDIAENEALYATFQHDSFIARSLMGAKQWLNKAQVKGFGLGDVVVRYPKTPGNLVAVGMDYSPYGFFKGLVQFAKLNQGSNLAAQREAVRNLGRGITGTGLITGGYILAQNNVITARKDSDKDVNSLQRNQGQPPFSFNFSALNRMLRGEDTKPRPGDVIANYDWLQPNAIQLSMGANMALNKDAGNKDWISSTLDQAAMGLETIEEQPILAQTGRFFQTATTPADRGGGIPNAIKDSVVGLPSMFVPSVLNQTAASIDNQARTSYDPNPIKQATNKVVAKLPFASKSLEPVVDSFGNEVKRQQTDNPVTRVFNSFINPAFVTKLKQTPEGQMVLDLYDKTGEKGQFPRVTDRKMQINGESYSLSPKEITEFQKFTGKETEKAFADLANNPGFMNLPDDEKIKIMSGIITDISSAARIKILGNEPKTVTNDVKAILGGKVAGFQSKIPDGVNDIAKKYYEKTTFMDQETYDGWLKGEPDQIATEVAGDLNKRRPANTKELPAYNGLAKRYAEYEKAKAEAKKDGSWTKLDEKEKEQEFWKGAIKDSRDDLTKDIYDAGSSGSKDYWEQGLISKEDIDKAIALDDELYASGLSKTLKFSKTFRRSYGYGIPAAPGEKASGSGGSGGGGGRASKKTGVNELKLRYTPDAAPTVSRVPRNVQLKLTKPAPVQVTPVRIRL